MDGDVHIHPSEPALFRACAERLVAVAAEAVVRRGVFHWALAGGNTPVGVYRLLAGPLRDLIDWSKVHLYFGDERAVPPDHPDSNYRMARDAFLSTIAVPDTQVHRIHGELPPEQAAEAYAQELRRYLPKNPKGLPAFDSVLLGTGPDGHIASLFPGSEILKKRAPVAAVYVPKLDTWRVSLTLPVLNAARHVMLLVAGNKKADVVRHVFLGRSDTNPLPVQRLHPSGQLEWFLDREAARHVIRNPD